MNCICELKIYLHKWWNWVWCVSQIVSYLMAWSQIMHEMLDTKQLKWMSLTSHFNDINLLIFNNNDFYNFIDIECVKSEINAKNFYRILNITSSTKFFHSFFISMCSFVFFYYLPNLNIFIASLVFSVLFMIPTIIIHVTSDHFLLEKITNNRTQ